MILIDQQDDKVTIVKVDGDLKSVVETLSPDEAERLAKAILARAPKVREIANDLKRKALQVEFEECKVRCAEGQARMEAIEAELKQLG